VSEPTGPPGLSGEMSVFMDGFGGGGVTRVWFGDHSPPYLEIGVVGFRWRLECGELTDPSAADGVDHAAVEAIHRGRTVSAIRLVGNQVAVDLDGDWTVRSLSSPDHPEPEWTPRRGHHPMARHRARYARHRG